MIALCACVFLVWCGKQNLPEVTTPVVDTVKDVADVVVDGVEDVVDAVEEWEDLVDGAEEAGTEASGIIDALKERNDVAVDGDTDVAVTYVMNTEASSVNWEAGKIIPGGDHYGTVQLKEGSAVYVNNMLQSATAVLDMTTIASDSAWLDGHLKNEDFFDVENHPEATIVISSVETTDDPVATIATADLTIKWITNEITFPITSNDSLDVANITIDRTLWDIRYGSAKFFDDLADKAIKDEIEFEVNIAYVTE